MRISLKWLHDYLDFDISVNELAEKLTMIGLEVESIEVLSEKYKNFVVGEVIDIKKHPKGDKLTVCSVNIGESVLQIICGAPNVATHQKVPVALIDAVVPRNQHDPKGEPFKISRVSIRGIESSGMICSEYELEIGENKEGILVLNQNAVPGTPLSQYFQLDDTVFEIGLTPNRPDAMSHIGIARELGAIIGKDLKIPSVKLKECNKNIKDYARVNVSDTENCPRYTARVLFDIKIKPSPEWIQQRLKAIGLRPINNVVDITNYVLMECGHPLHAFDYDVIKDNTIVVRRAFKGEQFVTLDHKSRIMLDTTLMICDNERPIAMAGVMGGENSEISDRTKNIIIESAYFNPKSIRRTSKYYGLNTDASQRFERGADPNITEWAVDRAAELIRECAGGEILKGRIDVYPEKITPKIIKLHVNYANKFLDVNLTGDQIINILSRFHFKYSRQIKNNDDIILEFEIPTFRPDIDQEIDLIEEIARGYGYNNIPVKTNSHVTFSNVKPEYDFKDEIREIITGSGFREIVTNSMQSEAISSKFSDNYVKIINPISKDMSTLRTTMVPSMLEVIRHNIYHGSNDLRLFEIGKVYFHKPGKGKGYIIPDYIEKEVLVLGMVGREEPVIWDKKPKNIDIFDIKGEIETLFEKIFLDNIKFIPYSTTDALTEVGILIEINKVRAGYLGKIRKDILRGFDIEDDVYFAEMEIPVLESGRKKNRQFTEWPKFPPVKRDIAVIVDLNISSDAIEAEIRKAGGELLRNVELFDIYRGDQIGKHKKSYAYTMVFNADNRTLTQDEVDLIIYKISDNLNKLLNATIRKKEIEN